VQLLPTYKSCSLVNLFARFKFQRWDPSKPAPTVQDFDKKLVEADAYLQIVIDQVKRLEDRIEKTVDEESRARCSHIKAHAEDMLENIKHTIALLQIAKVSACRLESARPVLMRARPLFSRAPLIQ